MDITTMATIAAPPSRDSAKPVPVGEITAQQQSPFLRLAAELRNRIYEEAFDTTIIVSEKDKSTSASRTAIAGPFGSNHGIFLACKQTHSEAIGLYYSVHLFRAVGDSWNGLFQMEDECFRWLKAIGRERSSLVKHFELDVAAAYNVSAVPHDWKHLERVAGLAESSLRGIRQLSHLSQEAVVTATILSPLSSDAQGKYSVVRTVTPMETLKEHYGVLVAHALSAAAENPSI